MRDYTSVLVDACNQHRCR